MFTLHANWRVSATIYSVGLVGWFVDWLLLVPTTTTTSASILDFYSTMFTSIF